MGLVKLIDGPRDGQEFTSSSVPDEWRVPIGGTPKREAVYMLASTDEATETSRYTFDRVEVHKYTTAEW